VIIETVADRNQWNNALRNMPCAHVLQTWEWGVFKQATTGWIPSRYTFKDDGKIQAMASILIRKIGPLSVMYIPKGPALRYEDSALLSTVFNHIEAIAKKRRVIWLKIDPDVIIATGAPGEKDESPSPIGVTVINLLEQRGWRFSGDQVQFRNTVALDLTQSEDDLLAAMSQNTRRKVRTATKKDVIVRTATEADLPTLYHLYKVTGDRDDFLTRPADYYERAWRDFMQAGLAHALIAEFDGKPIAHVVLFHFGKKCWYFYGASSNEERNRMPNYLLQWEAIKWAKAHGYAVYDMWGAPDEFVETDSMWGVYEFKRGFRGTVARHIGAWDYVPQPLLYTAYTKILPRLRAILRHRA
jgi:lipid II:glycine glycyltransferase (peptidoglycan interpeptide bridge formation enzyme)